MKMLNRLRKIANRKEQNMPTDDGIAYTKEQLEKAILAAYEADKWFDICIYQEEYRQITGHYFSVVMK